MRVRRRRSFDFRKKMRKSCENELTKYGKFTILFKSMVPRLDIRKLIAEKKYAGDLVFAFEAEENLVDIPYVTISSPVNAELRYEILEDDTVEVKGTVSFTLKGLCSRCLKETEQRIVGDAEGYFIPEGGKGEEEDYTYSNGFIDLREFLRDAVMFIMPAGLLCSEDCTAPDYKED